MLKILIASGNSHKHHEISRLLETSGAGDTIELVRPLDLVSGETGPPSPPPDPVEDGSTYFENARIKAIAFSAWSGLPALADDSGLEVDALGGEPGLKSARYAGENVDFQANIDKVLGNLEGVPLERRGGRFICSLVLAHGDTVLFSGEGTCPGTVLESMTGRDGFGYDPIFRPEGETRSFAELSDTEKDAQSHRGIAWRIFVEHLRTNPLHPIGSEGQPHR